MTLLDTTYPLPEGFPTWLAPKPNFRYPEVTPLTVLYPTADAKLREIYVSLRDTGTANDRLVGYSLPSLIFEKLEAWINKIDKNEDFNMFILQACAYKTLIDLYSIDSSWWDKIDANYIIKPSEFISAVEALVPGAVGTSKVDTSILQYDLPNLVNVINKLDSEPNNTSAKKEEASAAITDIIVKFNMKSMFESITPNAVEPLTKEQLVTLMFKDKKWKAAKDLFGIKLEVPSSVS